jgi:hypothetical protein
MILDFARIAAAAAAPFTGVIHVGGHHGTEYPLYRSLGLRNLHFFEPYGPSYQILRASVGPECLCYNVALGSADADGVAMHVESANKGMSNSLMRPKVHQTQYPHIQFNSEAEV